MPHARGGPRRPEDPPPARSVLGAPAVRTVRRGHTDSPRASRLGVWGPPAHPRQGTLPGMAAACKEDPDRGRLAVWAQPRVTGKRLRPLGLSFPPGRWPGPLPPWPLPFPSPRGCREEREPGSRGPASKDETTRRVMVVTPVTGGVSRSARGAFHHLGLGSPLRTVFIWP